MRRLMFPTLLALLIASGCNLSDNVTFPGPDNQTTPNHNNPEDDAGSDAEDTSPGAPLSLEVTDLKINGDDLPISVEAATGDLSVEAAFHLTNSEGCVDCNLQLLVALDDGPPSCLYDGPAGSDLEGATTLATLQSAGEATVYVHAVESEDCDSAIALGNIAAGEAAGTITFTPARLVVVAFQPSDGALSVATDATIRVGFNAAVDEDSLADNIRLEQSNGDVIPVTLTRDANGVILRPDAPLTEFQTDYKIVVEAGITSGDRELVDNFEATFQTRMFVAAVQYVASPTLVNDTAYLAIRDGDFVGAILLDAANDDRAHFRFVNGPAGTTGLVAYNDRNPGRSLAINEDGELWLQQANLNDQLWSFVRQDNGSFWIRNSDYGDDMSLEVAPSLIDAPPTMRPTLTTEEGEDRQDWFWSRAPVP